MLNPVAISPESIALGDLPFIPFSVVGTEKVREIIAETSAVYFFLLGNNYPVYIGETQNLMRRILLHNKKGHGESLGCTRLAWMEMVCDGYTRRTTEKIFIHYYLPPLNWTIWHTGNSFSNHERTARLKQQRLELFGVDFD